MKVAHPLALLMSFVALQAIGFAWYHEALFGTVWLEDVGFDPSDMAAPPASVWIVMTLATIIKIVLLSIILRALDVRSVSSAIGWGALLGFGLLALTLASHHGFAMRPMRQSLIEGSQEVVGLMVAAAILTAWPTGGSKGAARQDAG